MSRPSDSRSGTLVGAFAARLVRLGLRPGPALVAVSGGVDSFVLLDLLARTRDQHRLDLIVVHANHGMHPDAGAIAGMVRARAVELGLPYADTELRLGPGSTETRAREARRAWLEQLRTERSARYIFLAHQADDQAETVLMRLLAGSGPAGLAGMRARQGPLVRPLLDWPRATLLRYARARGITWWEDPANADRRHLRSWLRQEVLPVLGSRIPDLAERLQLAGRHAATHRRAWSGALRRWPGLEYRREGGVHSVSLPALEPLPASLRLVLIETLARRAGARPGERRLRAAWRTLAPATSGATADLGRGWRLERAWDRLRVLPPAREAPPDPGTIDGERGAMAWGDFRLAWTLERAPAMQPREGDSAWFVPGALLVRPWRAGDRLAPLHGVGRRLAVRCFQDARIASSDRRRWPVLEGAGGLAWIPGVCRADVQVPRAGEPALRVDVSRHD